MIVAIEGGDQAGKQTQSVMLKEALEARDMRVRLFEFPDYATQTGKLIKEYLHGREPAETRVLHCLQAANRWERYADIRAAQKENDVLIMNRYYHSNVVYGMANGLEREWLQNLDHGMPEAGLVIVLDISIEDSFARKTAGRDAFERDRGFVGRILQGYREMAGSDGWKVIKATGTKDEVHAAILKACQEAKIC